MLISAGTPYKNRKLGENLSCLLVSESTTKYSPLTENDLETAFPLLMNQSLGAFPRKQPKLFFSLKKFCSNLHMETLATFFFFFIIIILCFNICMIFSLFIIAGVAEEKLKAADYKIESGVWKGFSLGVQYEHGWGHRSNVKDHHAAMQPLHTAPL